MSNPSVQTKYLTILNLIVVNRFVSIHKTSYSMHMTQLVNILHLRSVPMHYQQKSNPTERNHNTVSLQEQECLEQMLNDISRTDPQPLAKSLQSAAPHLKQNRKILNMQSCSLKRQRSFWLMENL